jgi:ribosomal-protein-alanine N-acetyltransferase
VNDLKFGVDVVIRPMHTDDIDSVVAIELQAFTSPWKAETFLGLIGRDGAELWVIEHSRVGVIAYGVLWCLLDQGELANMAVAPEFLGQGLAVELLNHLLEVASNRGVESIYLEVRESNERAADLYLGFGFEEIGRRESYYNFPKEDARVMRIEL